MIRIAIIGAGNMGAAIAEALCASELKVSVAVSNPSAGKTEKLKSKCGDISIFTDNVKAIEGADVIIYAVKPWILAGVAAETAPFINPDSQVVVSVAGGVAIDELAKMFGTTGSDGLKIFRAIPNTAIALGKGMTFVSHHCQGSKEAALVRSIFGCMGEVGEIEERQIDAATALSSCGIAYVMKGMQAAVQAGVELGFRPSDALRYVCATVAGAAALLGRDGAQPQVEIDKVTTPGGMTIKGINSLEHDGYASAIINAILAPLKR